MVKKTLTIHKLHVTVDNKPIVNGVSLTINPGEIHAIMGPNGSGKSTLAYALAGHPFYEVTSGTVHLGNHDLLSASPDKRAQLGLFLAFQYPIAIEGVSVQNFLKVAYQAIHGNAYPPFSAKQGEKKFPILKFRQDLEAYANQVGIDKDLLSRSLNDGFSGGEKKRVEVIQMLSLAPKFAILDETDSGLDIDSIKLAAKGIKQVINKYHTGCLVITHYQRILQYLTPNVVHVMQAGKIIKTGDMGLVQQLEKRGYKYLTNNSEK